MPTRPKLKSLCANKNGPVNPGLFNLLENLLVFRTMPELSVPQESSVRFRISRQEGEPGICLLIHIDEQLFPVIQEGVPRPDYLALYLHGDGCLCTIIEMKSTAGKNLRHGVEQIKTLAETLRAEFKQHLPARFKLVIQGILLCQPNADIPGELIKKVHAGGLTILAAQYHHRAELYPYISQRNNLNTRFMSISQRPGNRSFIETMVSECTLRTRLSDDLTKARGGEGRREGLHINFMLSENGEYATLVTRERQCVFVVSETGDDYLQALRGDIAANGLEDKFVVEPMPIADVQPV